MNIFEGIEKKINIFIFISIKKNQTNDTYINQATLPKQVFLDFSHWKED